MRQPKTYTDQFIWVRLPSTTLKAVRWLLRLTKDRFRPDLAHIFREDNALLATDGLAIHAVPIPDGWPEEAMVAVEQMGISFADQSVAFLIGRKRTWEEIREEMPHPIKMPPRERFKEVRPVGEPTFKIAVNPILLRRALEYPASKGRNAHVVLAFWHKDRPMEIRSDDSYVLLMPMHMDDGYPSDRDHFRPAAMAIKPPPRPEPITPHVDGTVPDTVSLPDPQPAPVPASPPSDPPQEPPEQPAA